MNFNQWDKALREILQYKNSPLRLHDGRFWEIKNKFENLNLVKNRIFDKHLKLLQEIFLQILGEVNPKFELEPDKHYMAAIYDKKLRYSNRLREGLAETLVWLGLNGNSLVNCSPDKRISIAHVTIRELLSDASWQLWGSLNDLLPILAEADPEAFIDTVQASLQRTPSPFDELFKQEGDGLFGGNYLTGLYWALESLAWGEEYLVQVCTTLAELSEHDPGGRWANRPSNSICEILLPWYPQTMAPIEKRIAAVRAMQKQSPNTTWKVLINLLPNSHQVSSGTHKPRWRNPVSEDWKPTVTQGEYWEHVEKYATVAVEMAYGDLSRTKELVENLDNLPKPLFEQFLEYLSSELITGLSESERTPLWAKLIQFINKHRRFSDTNWALPEEFVKKIEVVAENIKPASPFYFDQFLFSNRDFDLYEENGNWKEEQQKLLNRRQIAIKEIYKANGLSEVLSFVRVVDSPGHVGAALGSLVDFEEEDQLLPALINSDDENVRNFIGGYVWSRFYLKGWAWVDSIKKSHWSLDQLCQFLVFLPFTQKTWECVEKWLNKDEGMYWKSANVNPYQSDSDVLLAVDKLLAHERPMAAIECLFYRLYEKYPFDPERTISALLKAVNTNEPIHSMDSHHIVELIKKLQTDPKTNEEGLFRVEWAYLKLLERDQKTKPTLIEKRLRTDPKFFCEVIRLIYRSDKEPETTNKDPDEDKKAIASQAWYLLHHWKTPPGLDDDGNFSSDHFYEWFQNVQKECAETGHLDVAMITIGGVLLYSPPDPDGLWIVHKVAEVLNNKNLDSLRRGFNNEVHNSRGVHWVDPSGNQEKELASSWRAKANAIENAGYARFAATLKKLADSYEREAERVVRKHKSDNIL